MLRSRPGFKSLWCLVVFCFFCQKHFICSHLLLVNWLPRVRLGQSGSVPSFCPLYAKGHDYKRKCPWTGSYVSSCSLRLWFGCMHSSLRNHLDGDEKKLCFSLQKFLKTMINETKLTYSIHYPARMRYVVLSTFLDAKIFSVHRLAPPQLVVLFTIRTDLRQIPFYSISCPQ